MVGMESAVALVSRKIIYSSIGGPRALGRCSELIGSVGLLRKRADVSVIIPCYNCSSTLDRALESVYSQTLLPAEVIVIIDGFGGGGVDQMLEEWARVFSGKGVKLKVLRLERNFGPGAARNKGWSCAERTYVAFLDADDAWHPEKLARQISVMEARGLSFSAHYYRVQAHRFRGGNLKGGLLRELSPWKLLVSNPIATPTVILRREIPFRFKEDGLAEDYYLWLKLAFSGVRPYFLQEPLAFGFKDSWGERGLSARLWQMEVGELVTLWQLGSEGFYPKVLFPLLALWSLIKFVRRLGILGVKRAFKIIKRVNILRKA